jgi:c-di-GMP-binding flagellar brake protein YcgR
MNQQQHESPAQARPEPETADYEQYYTYARREIIGVIEDIIAHAPSEAQSQRLLESRHITFVTFVDQIKVQFHAQRAEATTWDGKPALRIRLPDSLLRLQRRNFYRVPPGRNAQLMCEIPLPQGGVARFAVGDISVGGLAMIAGPAHAELQAGTVFHNCKIELPGHGSFLTSLEIRNNCSDAGRYGCQFLNLAGPVVSLIQRYINQLERTRRSLG